VCTRCHGAADAGHDCTARDRDAADAERYVKWCTNCGLRFVHVRGDGCHDMTCSRCNAHHCGACGVRASAEGLHFIGAIFPCECPTCNSACQLCAPPPQAATDTEPVGQRS
jgi:hypothetical protein